MLHKAAVLSACLATPVPVVAQAPPWADLWRVADGTLARPGALADAPTGAFWNPAAVVGPAGLRAAVDAFETPEVVNVRGVLLGAAFGVGNRVGLGVLAGRMSVGDLIRTTSSPVSIEGEIPVYSQFLGTAVAGRAGPLRAGVSLLLHDGRLDGLDEHGVTLDLGLTVTPVPGLAVGAATHLGNPVVAGSTATEYLFGVEYGFATPHVLGLESRLSGRYGVTVREWGASEHLATAGLLLGRRLLIDAGAIWAGGYGTGAWQPVLGLAFRAGAYGVGIVRGNGAGGTGAAYRVTLAVGETP